MDKGKLSTAIRIGAKLRPQSQICLEHPTSNGTCALGAAFHAVMGMSPLEFEKSHVKISGQLMKTFPQLRDKLSYYNPVSEGHSYHLASCIVYLNDTLCWTREQIADWLEEKGY
jgi:hypothetical protein